MDVVINNKEMNQAKFEEIFATMDELQQEMNEQEEAEEIETFGIEGGMYIQGSRRIRTCSEIVIWTKNS